MAVRATLLDVDGTLTFRGAPIPGAGDTVATLRAQGMRLRVLTNIDSRTPEQVRRDLARLGIPVAPGEVFTPLTALRRFMAERPTARFHLLLSRDFVREVGREGGTSPGAAAEQAAVAGAATPGAPDYVVVGDFRDDFTYQRLNAAFRSLQAGAQLVALQMGRFFLREDGAYLDTGAVVRALEYAAGVTAQVLGKPDPEFLRLALADAGCLAEEAVVVGDDPTTDLAGAAAVGALGVMVRTGKFAAADLALSPHTPAAVIDSVADLPAWLAGGVSGG